MPSHYTLGGTVHGSWGLVCYCELDTTQSLLLVIIIHLSLTTLTVSLSITHSLSLTSSFPLITDTRSQYHPLNALFTASSSATTFNSQN
jgi:hypothetical protein